MIGVTVTFQYANDFDAAKLRSIAESAQKRFVGMPGLRSKTFTVDAQNRRAVNVYLWDSREAADGFFTPQLTDAVVALYGARPEIAFLDVVALVDNASPTAVPA